MKSFYYENVFESEVEEKRVGKWTGKYWDGERERERQREVSKEKRNIDR